MVIEGDWTLDGEHTIQYTDDVLQNYTLETYEILLTNVTPINSIKIQAKNFLINGNCTTWMLSQLSDVYTIFKIYLLIITYIEFIYNLHNPKIYHYKTF